MHVAFDARAVQDHFPGIGRYSVHLLEALAGVEPHLKITAFYVPDAPRRDDSLARLGKYPNVELVAAPDVLAPRGQFIMRRLIARHAPDVVHSPYYVAPFLSPAPLVVTIHDLIPLTESPGYARTAGGQLYLWLHRLAVRRAVQIITVSGHAAGAITAHLKPPSGSVSVIPGAAAPHFRPASRDEIQRVQHCYGIDAPYLLHVGINKPHKNQATLIEAFAALSRDERARDELLVLAGPLDSRYPHPKTIAEAAGVGERIRVLGPVPDEQLPALYTGALVFVFPSLAEGFGLPLIEAMACGTPVAYSARAPLPEVAGEAGVGFDPTSAQSIAEVLASFLQHPTSRLEERARSMARAADFTWPFAARATLEVYRKAVAQGDRDHENGSE